MLDLWTLSRSLKIGDANWTLSLAESSYFEVRTLLGIVHRYLLDSAAVAGKFAVRIVMPGFCCKYCAMLHLHEKIVIEVRSRACFRRVLHVRILESHQPQRIENPTSSRMSKYLDSWSYLLRMSLLI